jgi:hypothetical protein
VAAGALGLVTAALAAGPALATQGAGPVVDADPTVQLGVCGTGVSVVGTGSTADCSPPQQAAPAPSGSGSLVTADPSAQVGICGTGVSVVGTGSTADCSGGESTGSPGSSGPSGTQPEPALADVSPSVRFGGCGTGAAVLGTGSTADCAAKPAASSPSSDGRSNALSASASGSRGVTVAGESVQAAATVQPASQGSASGALAFTGLGTLLPMGLGLGACGAGGTVLRMRRLA